MPIKPLLALAIAAALVGCNRNQDADGGTTNTPAAEPAAPAVTDTQPGGLATPPGTDAAMAVSQDEALALLNAVNDHEIKAAEMAKAKNVTGPVLEYANMMAAEHGKNMADTTALMQRLAGTAAAPGPAAGPATATVAAPVGAETARVTEKKAQAAAKEAQLQKLDGEAFAKAYIDEMVTGHADTLAMLDSQLIPAATDEAARAHLTTTRGHVAMHLEKAREIQGQMGAAGGTGG